MKIRYLILTSLVLTILMLGAVSASENVTDTLNVTEDFGDELSADNDNSDADSDGGITVSSKVYTDTQDTIVDVWSEKGYLDGKLITIIDDDDVYEKSFAAADKHWHYEFELSKLHKIPSFGLHKVNATYYKSNGTTYHKVKDVNFTYGFKFMFENYYDEEEWMPICYGDKATGIFYTPQNSNGRVDFKINNKNYSVNIKNGKGTFNFAASDFNVGNNTLIATFFDSSKKYPQQTLENTFRVYPKKLFSGVISLGEKETMDIISQKGVQITVTLTSYPDKVWANYTFNGGMLSIPLDKIVTKAGSYDIDIDYYIGDYKMGWDGAYFNCYINSKGFKSSVSKVGDSATVKLTGPKIKADAEVYLDHKMVKKISLKNGVIKYKFSKLSIGKHQIKVYFHDGKKVYSKTHIITVDESDKVSLSLKTVKVKKNAKKLVLTATLKLNKKAKKGLKVVFKFNGKTYKAKTNKNGVAKVTVKKNVLKKLKRGKKVTYKAKYSFKTVKKTAKVR